MDVGAMILSASVRRRLFVAMAAILIATDLEVSSVYGQCQAKLNAGDGAAGDQFGAGLSMSGDHILVGSPCDDDAGTSSGGAYIFARNHGGPDNWGQVTKLTPDDPTEGDELGFPVSLSGELAIVGARLCDDVAFSAGAAYIFAQNQRGPDNWGQMAKLSAADGAVDDIFGQSVSINGDVAIVGAPRHDGTGSNSGAAYVFARDRGGPDNWGQIAKLTAGDAGEGDLFGQSVSVSGDIAVVGSHRDDDAGNNAGAAYVFARNQGGPDNWGQVTKLTAADGAAEDQFGYAVFLSSDLLLVGARRDDDNGENSGSAYIYSRNEGGPDNWGQVAKLTADDGEADDSFGGGISISDDRAIVGAPFKDGPGFNTGASYIFERNHGGPDNWGQVAKLTASDAAAQDQFGFPSSISGDRVVVGAYRDDDLGSESGSVYVFNLFDTPVVENTPMFVNSLLNTTVDCEADVNLDGKVDGRDIERFIEIVLGT